MDEDVVTALTTGVEYATQMVGFVGTKVTGVLGGCERKGSVVAMRLGSHRVVEGILAAILSLTNEYRGGSGEVAGMGDSTFDTTGVSPVLGDVSPMWEVDIRDDIPGGVTGISSSSGSQMGFQSSS